MLTTMNMHSGYWLLPFNEESIPKTAFVRHRGQFKFFRMHFCLATAPSMYKRCVNWVLADYMGKFGMVFTHSIVYSLTLEENQEHVAKVLATLSSYGLTLKDSKCHWAHSQITYCAMWFKTKASHHRLPKLRQYGSSHHPQTCLNCASEQCYGPRTQWALTSWNHYPVSTECKSLPDCHY